MSALLPQAAGTLSATPFSRLLLQALQTRSTGTLVLEEPAGTRHGVYFEAGSPSKAKTRSPGIHLGEVLVDYGKLSLDRHEDTLERALRERVLHGQLLLNEGLINEETLDLGLREQLVRQILWLFERPEHTRYGYFEGKDLLAHWGGAPVVRVDPHELLWRSLHDRPDAFDVEGALAGLAGRDLGLAAELDDADFEFMGWESATVRRLRERPQRMTDLLAERPGEAASIRRVLCFLVLTRSLVLGSRASSQPGRARPISVRTESFREELRQRVARLESSHYAVLGVPETASEAQVKAAFARRAPRFHPERLAREAPADREAATRVFVRFAEAARVLTDPTLRRNYDTWLANQREPGNGNPWSRLLRRRN